MQENIYELMIQQQQKQEISRVLSCNEKTQKFGLVLTEEEAERLAQCRKEVLVSQRRVEFGEGILPKIIESFCDSSFIELDGYAEILEGLQEIFYLYKNESEDNLTDDELIAFMREQFDEVCFGSFEYLSETCLERFARAIREGYRGYKKTAGTGEYSRLSEEERWDRNLFLSALEELIE